MVQKYEAMWKGWKGEYEPKRAEKVQHWGIRINLPFPFSVLADQFIQETITSELQLCAVLKNWITHIHLYITKDFSLWFTRCVMTSASRNYFFLLLLDFNIFIQY